MARYFVRFKEETEREMVMGSFVLAAAPESETYAAMKDPHLLIADLGPEEVESAQESGAEVFEDVLFQVVAENPLLPNRLSENWEYWAEPVLAEPAPAEAAALAALTQNDVVEHVNAPQAWESTRGEGVTIAIVDTGISAVHAEFPDWKRSPHSLSFAFDDPWSDPKGHGSMCASAAGATDADGGRVQRRRTRCDAAGRGANHALLDRHLQNLTTPSSTCMRQVTSTGSSSSRTATACTAAMRPTRSPGTTRIWTSCARPSLPESPLSSLPATTTTTSSVITIRPRVDRTRSGGSTRSTRSLPW